MTRDIRCSVGSSATTRTLRRTLVMARNHKSTYVLIRSVCYFLSILTTSEFPRQIFAKTPIKMVHRSFQYEPSYCVRTDGQTWWDDGDFSRILHTHTDGHMSRDISCFCNFSALLQYHILHKRVACSVREILSIAKCV
jgi:hypothetical protein